MNVCGWTSWGWLELQNGAAPLRRWKWHAREDVFVETNDDDVLIFLAGAMKELDG